MKFVELKAGTTHFHTVQSVWNRLLKKTTDPCSPPMIPECLVLFQKSRHFLSQHLRVNTFIINCKPTGFLKSYIHLGHSITNNLNDDITSKQANSLDKLITFYATSDIFLAIECKLLESSRYSFFGCELWSLDNCNI